MLSRMPVSFVVVALYSITVFDDGFTANGASEAMVHVATKTPAAHGAVRVIVRAVVVFETVLVAVAPAQVTAHESVPDPVNTATAFLSVIVTTSAALFAPDSAYGSPVALYIFRVVVNENTS